MRRKHNNQPFTTIEDLEKHGFAPLDEHPCASTVADLPCDHAEKSRCLPDGVFDAVVWVKDRSRGRGKAIRLLAWIDEDHFDRKGLTDFCEVCDLDWLIEMNLDGPSLLVMKPTNEDLLEV